MAAGYRSFDAVWLGGASAISGAVPPTPIPVFAGGMAIPLRKKRIDDDDDVIIIISQHLAKTRWKKDG